MSHPAPGKAATVMLSWVFHYFLEFGGKWRFLDRKLVAAFNEGARELKAKKKGYR